VSLNFRLISNLNNISKILERLFLARLLNKVNIYIASSPTFNHLQSPCRKHHPTEISLIHLLDSIYHAADNGLATLPSLDLSAAFDTIDHSILLNHLTSSLSIPLTPGLGPISLQQVFLSHFRLLFLFHNTFIVWCSPRLCLRSHPFHNLCLT